MRLIDASALKMEVRKEYDRLYPTASGEFDEFATRVIPYIIDEQPTVDAVPTRYGKWIIKEEYFDFELNCSLCGEQYWIEKGEIEAHKPNFCPHCGAKME